jgi:hypothetical protein
VTRDGRNDSGAVLRVARVPEPAWRAEGRFADRLLALLSGNGLPDVGEQLGLRAFSSLFPLSASWTSDLSGSFVARRTQLGCDGWEGMAERRHISFFGLALTAAEDSRKPPQTRGG